MAKPNWKWQTRAICRGIDEDQNPFFGPDGERQPEKDVRERKAKAICDECPVVLACREAAFVLKMDNGVWGGLGEDERRSKRRSWMRRGSQCGVSAA